MTRPAWGIVTPTSVEVMCAEPGTAAVSIGALSAPFTQAGVMGSTEEEYVLGNAVPLAALCRTLELRVTNGSWTSPAKSRWPPSSSASAPARPAGAG